MALRFLSNLSETGRRFGAVALVRKLADRALYRCVGFDAAHLLYIVTQDIPPQQTVDALGEFDFPSPDDVARIAPTPELGLNPALVLRARRGHDRCYALLKDDEVLHYGWCALDSIDPEFFAGTSMSFPANLVYVYNVFTPEAHRGRGLNGACLAAALQKLSDDGVTGCLAAVHWTNEASLRSFRRLGARDLGLLISARALGRRLERTPPAAAELDVLFGAEAFLSPRRFPRPTPQAVCLS